MGEPRLVPFVDPRDALSLSDQDATSTEASSDEEKKNSDDNSAEIESLRRRRAYVIAQLYNVGQSIRTTEADLLARQGLPEVRKRDLAPKDTVDEVDADSFLHAVDWEAGTVDGPGPKPLTDRATERAGALLRFFDADGDGCLSFDEFRAYLVALGRDKGKLGERLVTNRDFWMMYISDQAGARTTSGGAMTVAGKITEAGFVEHRRQIEREHPLEQDLLSMGIDVLPEYLGRWELAKAAFDRVDFEGVIAAMEVTGGGDMDPGAQCQGTIAREETQLLLADAGEVMTQQRLEEELSLAMRRAKVMYEIVEERRKRNRLAPTQALSRAAAYDSTRVYRGSWLSWLMSGRAKEDHISWIERMLILAKTRVARRFREFVSLVGVARSVLEGLSQRGLISSALLTPLKESDARITARVAVGDVEDDGTGFFVSFTFLQRGNASMENPVDQLPPGVGLSVSLDLEAKDNVMEEELQSATEAVGTAIRTHVLSEVKRSPVFHSMRASTATVADKSRVIRIALFWRPQANIDFVFRQLKLGIRAADLVREFTATLFCPIAITEILGVGKALLNDSLMLSLTAEACFCGPLIAKLLEEYLAGIEDGFHQSVADSVEHDSDRVEREARTRDAAPGMTHPLIPPKRKQGGFDNRSGGTFGSAAANTQSGVGGRGGGDALAAIRMGPGRRQTEREKRDEASRKRKWLNTLWSLATKLRGTRTLALDLEAATPVEFLESTWIRAFLPNSWKNRLVEVLTTPGLAGRWFDSWKASFLRQASVLERRALAHRDGNILKHRAADDQASAFAKTDEGRRLADLEADLARLGLSSTTLAQVMGEKEEETTRRLREAKDRQMEDYANLAEAFRMCSRHLLGPSELKVQSGLNLLVVEMQGVDIFEALSPEEGHATEEKRSGPQGNENARVGDNGGDGVDDSSASSSEGSSVDDRAFA